MKKQLSILAGVVMPLGLLAACGGSGQRLGEPEAGGGTLISLPGGGSHTGGYGDGGTTSGCFEDEGCSAVGGTSATGGYAPSDGGTGMAYGGYSAGGSYPTDGGYSAGGAVPAYGGYSSGGTWAGAGGYSSGGTWAGAGGYSTGDGGTGGYGDGGTSSGGYDPTCQQNVSHCFEAAANCYQYSPWSDCDQIVDVCDAIQDDCE